MASIVPLQTRPCAYNPLKQTGHNLNSHFISPVGLWNKQQVIKKRSSTVVAVAGDVSADGTTYLIAGAAAVALLGTAFPILFSRKDLCPECDGAGFVRKSGVTLRANAARKDQTQIVCARCNGLGKLNQVDK
ncbi:hypothetical protein QQ045_022968 [Rhodiola kirilowii]